MEQTISPGIYEHSKTKRRYEVIGTARSTDNPQKLSVIYRQLYEGILEPTGIPLPFGTLWTRPIEQFFAKVETSPGVIATRFTKVLNP